jgi:spore coat-associated protein N
MSRFKVLRANPRRALAAMATLLIAVGVTAASGASFTASSVNSSNTFTAGTLSMSNDKAGAAIFSASNMKPGDVATGEVDIKNTGSVNGAFTLAKTALTNNNATYKMSTQLNVVISDCGTDSDCSSKTLVTSGTLDAIANSAVSVGTIPGGVTHRYEFVATFDSNADNNYQSKSTTAEFTWNAS